MRSPARDISALAAAAAVSLGGLVGCSYRGEVVHKHEGPNGPIYPYLNEMEARIGHVNDARKSSLMAVAALRDTLDGVPETDRAAERAALLIFEGQALRITDLQMRLRLMSTTNEIPSDRVTQEIAMARRLGAMARDFATPLARENDPNRPLDTVLQELEMRGDSLSVSVQSAPRSQAEGLNQLHTALVRVQLNGATAHEMAQSGDPSASRWAAQMVALASMVQIDAGQVRDGTSVNPMIIDADYRIGIGARALTALWLLQVNPVIAEARNTLSQTAATQLAGESIRDAQAFATFRAWFGSQLDESNKAAWDRTPLQDQVRVWLQFRELNTSAYRGAQAAVPVSVAYQEIIDVVNATADRFELIPPPATPAAEPAVTQTSR